MAETVELLQNAGLKLVLLAVVVFGVAPGLVLRLLVRIYPKNDPRRQELLAELYAVPYLERPLFVGQQFETVLFEGVPHRVKTINRVLRKQDDAVRVTWLYLSLGAGGVSMAAPLLIVGWSMTAAISVAFATCAAVFPLLRMGITRSRHRRGIARSRRRTASRIRRSTNAE